jgi:hypothetical protein
MKPRVFHRKDRAKIWAAVGGYISYDTSISKDKKIDTDVAYQRALKYYGYNLHPKPRKPRRVKVEGLPAVTLFGDATLEQEDIEDFKEFFK